MGVGEGFANSLSAVCRSAVQLHLLYSRLRPQRLAELSHYVVRVSVERARYRDAATISESMRRAA